MIYVIWCIWCMCHMQITSIRTTLKIYSRTHHSMSFNRLAEVECQLILHYCDQHTWLSLARCSHFTYSSASKVFASRHLPPITIDATSKSFSAPTPGLFSSLLQLFNSTFRSARPDSSAAAATETCGIATGACNRTEHRVSEIRFFSWGDMSI